MNTPKLLAERDKEEAILTCLDCKHVEVDGYPELGDYIYCTAGQDFYREEYGSNDMWNIVSIARGWCEAPSPTICPGFELAEKRGKR